MNYYYIKLSHTSASQHQGVLFISLMEPVKGAQFLNIIFLFLFSVSFAAHLASASTSFSAPLIVTFLFRGITIIT